MSPQTPAGQILGGVETPCNLCGVDAYDHTRTLPTAGFPLSWLQTIPGRFQDPRSIFPGIVAGNITAYSTAVAHTVVSMPYTALQRY